jgi:Flp pilus assembly protein TadD
MGKLWGKDIPERMKGIVFVSASWLDLEGQPGAPLAPFYASEPTARLGGSAMLVYAGEFDTHVAAARALANKAKRDIETGNPAQALPVARQAVEVAQSFPYAHYWYGIALAANGQPQEGLLECSIARRLALEDGWNQARNREAAAIQQQMEEIAQKFDLSLPPAVE